MTEDHIIFWLNIDRVLIKCCELFFPNFHLVTNGIMYVLWLTILIKQHLKGRMYEDYLMDLNDWCEVVDYSLWSEISVGDLVQTLYYVSTKSLSIISDRSE
jgi:hypothetical protein